MIYWLAKCLFDYLIGLIMASMSVGGSPSSRTSPRIVRTNHRFNVSPSTHVGGFHHVVYGGNVGACLCLSSCCYSDIDGCVCRSCSGRGHYNCVVLNAKRANDRGIRERAKSRAGVKARAIERANRDRDSS